MFSSSKLESQQQHHDQKLSEGRQYIITPKKRKDIQQMRGIAIFLVLLNHSGIPGFKNGFIGVDIFFVISGYVITATLLRNMPKMT